MEKPSINEFDGRQCKIEFRKSKPAALETMQLGGR
jgi:hypothetical protein